MTREQFVRFVDAPDRLERHLRAAAAITRLLEARELRPVVVGGSAVEFYTRGAYATADLDLVVPGLEEVARVLEALGFERRGASFVHPDVPIVVDLPPEPLAGDPGRLSVVEVGGWHVYVMGIEDLVADRLRAAAYWNDDGSKEWAVQLLAVYWDDLDWAYLQRLSACEPDARYARVEQEARRLAERLRRESEGRGPSPARRRLTRPSARRERKPRPGRPEGQG